MITKKEWGTMPDGRAVQLYTLNNENGMTISVSTYGAHLVSVLVPDKNGVVRDVVLGYDNLEGYLACNDYIGATVGRFANRLEKAQFSLNGKTYKLTVNDGSACLHGGGEFSHDLWTAEVDGDTLVMTFQSPDGAHGYPGNMTAKVRFSLDAENALHLDYAVESDAETIVNMTNHAYFNLFGGHKPMLEQKLWLDADVYSAVTEELIPIEDRPVEGTMFDFRTPKAVGEAVYDHNFMLNAGDGPKATVWAEENGIYMEMFTDLPGVQVYASCMLPEHTGKNGDKYGLGSGLCLETQLPPNTPNRPDKEKFSYTVKPGETWKTSTVYKFSIK